MIKHDGRARLRGHSRLIGAGIAAALLMGTVAHAQTLTIGMNNSSPPSLNPQQAREGNTITYFQPVYDTLLRRLPNGDIVPMLATEWSYNEDNTVLTLKLRDDVTFTDGAEFNADVAKANLDAFKAGGGPDSNTVSNIAEVRVIDPTTLEIELTAPDPGMLIFLSNAAGVQASPNLIGDASLDTAPVGSGPYVLDQSTTILGAQYNYIPNEDYWDPELQKFERITIIPMSNTTARLNALLSGEIDVALMTPETVAAAENGGMEPAITQINWNGFAFLDRDGVIAPELADVKVRQAMIHAVDRQALFDTIFGGLGIPAESIFSQATEAYLEEFDGYNVYPYDPDRARELLAEAGVPDGFSLPYPKNADDPPDLTAALVDYMAEVGITLELREIPGDDLRSELFAAQWPFWEASLFMGTDWLTIRQSLAPDALYNPFDTEREEVNAFIADIQTKSGEELTAAAEGLNRYLVENAWFMPVLRSDRLVYHNPRISVEPQIQQSMPSIYNYAPAE
jgi:peptide/nickel transport system substrate-binding protein